MEHGPKYLDREKETEIKQRRSESTYFNTPLEQTLNHKSSCADITKLTSKRESKEKNKDAKENKKRTLDNNRKVFSNLSFKHNLTKLNRKKVFLKRKLKKIENGTQFP